MKDNVMLKVNSATAEDWRKAVEKVFPVVVELHMTACRAFDTEYAGPVVAKAVFVNRKEIPVYPLYRDPVHDFGFFRCDPAAIKYLSYEEIPLAPEAASVGLEIRVIGNDSGEKIYEIICLFYLVPLLVWTGRLRNMKSMLLHNIFLIHYAPDILLVAVKLSYRRPFWDGYSDFNMFYLQAASDTKGGSSGSPVIDCQGRAVALNADSMTSSASAFYFPFERVARALKFLQNGVDCCQNKWEAVTIPSGTLQLVRNACPPSETGMLVVNSVVAPAYKSLVPGDVLVRMNGEVITHFLKMETLLDDGVGQNVELEFERNGKPLTVQLVVQDLHSIIPNSFLEVSGAVIHPLSYQQILINDLSCLDAKFLDAIFLTLLAEVPRHAIIKKLAGEDISNLEDFINALSMLSRGARSVLVALDCHEWYASPQIYTRDDTSGIWIGKQALPPNSQLISSFGIKQGLTNNRDVENCLVELVHQDVFEQLANRIASMDTSSFEHVTDGPHAHLEFQNMSGQQSMEGETGDKASSSTSSKQHSLVWKCFERIEVETPSDRKASLLPIEIHGENCSFEGHEEHQIAKGIPIHSLNQVLKEIISGANGPSLVINGVRRPMPLLRILEIELYPTLLYEARSFGLSNNWIQGREIELLVGTDTRYGIGKNPRVGETPSDRKGTLTPIDLVEDSSLPYRKVCVTTKVSTIINDRTKIIVKGKVYWIRIRELEPWSPELDDEFCESSSDDESVGEEKNNSITGDANDHVSESSFMNENIENVINEQEPPQDKISEDPFGIYSILNKQDNKEAGQDSDPSHPPGFTQEVNVGVSVNQPVHSDISPNIGGSQNVSGVNRSFCLKTGGSIMDVIENLVEVGQTMGYNMAGCKKNLEDIVASHGDSMVFK
ncbi:protease Do-like protein 7 isoform X2 [Tanacetum coccineum]|uniref:Protease Do-like protein 7 isoform X2 n=1 Tax=Tanacetum coccineum TaxID=301880 RepID=A0ABQ5GMH6_9ASTR